MYLFTKRRHFLLRNFKHAVVFCNKRLSENVYVDGIILPSAGMTKWFLSILHIYKQCFFFLLCTDWFITSMPVNNFIIFQGFFFFPIFSSLMSYDELQCYRYYPLYAMNDVAEQNKNVSELSRAFFSIAADNWSTDIFHQRARVNDNSSPDCDKKTSFHLP